MMKSFRDPVTGVLTTWGYVESNGADIARDEAEGFDLEPGKWRLVDGAWIPYVGNLKTALIANVDDHIATIYTKFQRFQLEYQEREKAAQTYKNAGYTGTYSPWIDSFANAAGLTINAATDLILQQAAQLRGALTQLGSIRMQKYGISVTVDEASATALHDQIIANANAIAAQL